MDNLDIQAAELKKNLKMVMYESREPDVPENAAGILITRIPEGWIYELSTNNGLAFVQESLPDILTDMYDDKTEKIGAIGKTAFKNKVSVLRLIIKLWKDGATYKEIADFLNEKEVVTFSKRGKWYAQSIHRMVVSNMTEATFNKYKKRKTLYEKSQKARKNDRS